MRFIHFDEYLDSVRKETPYAGTPEGRLLFLDQELNQAILLSNFILGEEKHLKIFKKSMGLEGVKYFRIILQDFRASCDGRTVWVLQNATTIQEKLKACATTYFHDTQKNAYYFDYWLDEECRNAFGLHFGTSLSLFQSLQLLLNLNLYSVSLPQKLAMYQSQSLYVNETIPTLPSDQRVMRFKDVDLKKSGVDSILYSKGLSDGENQLLHTLGLCVLYHGHDVLFLLDEPDTHFDPDWRSNFITCLKACLPDKSPANEHEMLITTHAPFLISDSTPNNVMVFDKSVGAVSISKPDYNTFGASINKITMTTFNKRETIGRQAQDVLEALRERFHEGDDKGLLIDEIHRRLGDSVEKVLLVKAILDSMPEGDE